LKDIIHSKAQKGLLLEEKINYFSIPLVSETQPSLNLVAESARITMLVLRKICLTKEGLAVDATFLVADMRKEISH